MMDKKSETEETTKKKMEESATNAVPPAPPAANEGKKKKKKDKKKKKKKKGGKSAEEKAKLKAMWAKNASKSTKKKKKVPPKEVFENKTPKGHKKDMSGPMLDRYSPPAVEAAWQDWWEAKGFYSANVSEAKDAKYEDKFVIVIPPPNVTGTLHLGHALTCSIQDTVCRWHRMCGKHVMWVPGTDHAGIATQSVVEKRLWREQKKTRHDLGREKFLEEVWKWKKEKGGRITTQLRRLGASVDWKREVFTMDEKLSKAVTEAFCRMHAKGKIYRAKRLVNWCCHLRTALSNIEVDDLELKGKTMLSVPGSDKKYPFGIFQKFAYKIADHPDDEELVVATTRLETMLGDTAVAIHPTDARYAKFHGKFVIHPFSGKKIPIVTDDILVDKTKGTGCVKITPAHDENDFKCGQRHGLEVVSIFDDDGCVNENGGEEFKGMFRYDARLAIQKRLEEMNLYRGTESKEMVIGICSRSKDVIEPMLKPQWWVDIDEMAERSMNAVRDGSLKLIPKDHEHTWFEFLGRKMPWCISRQLWWGHRIPAYLIKSKSNGDAAATKSTEDDESSDAYQCDPKNWVVARSQEEALAEAAKRRGCGADAIRLEQDPDVLDTWFSSGLFPFSVFGWPNKTDDLKAFFPTHLLETGMDILFFWVARMVMMSLELMDELPFKEVYLHAMVRDARGRKMSKSLGNVIDPLEIMDGASLDALHAKLRKGNLDPSEIKTCEKEQRDDFPDGIAQCGTDALRYTLTQYTRQGKSVNLDIKAVVGNRTFCTKLWNASRFLIEKCIPAGFKPKSVFQMLKSRPDDFSPRDLWILNCLNRAAGEINTGMRTYDFGAATQSIRRFVTDELSNIYVELVKPVIYGKVDATSGDDASSKTASLDTQKDVTHNVLLFCLERALRLLHPMMPFITEEIWQRLPALPGDASVETIMLSAYPQHTKELDFSEIAKSVDFVLSVIDAVRAVRSQFKLKNKDRPATYVCTDDATVRSMLSAQNRDIVTMTNVDLKIVDMDASLEGCVEDVVNDKCKIAMYLKGAIDAAAEIKKLEKKLRRLQFSLEKSQSMIDNPTIPPIVREKKKAEVAKYVEEEKILKGSIGKYTRLLD